MTSKNRKRGRPRKHPILDPWKPGQKLGGRWILDEHVPGNGHVWYVRDGETCAVAKRPKNDFPGTTELTRFHNEVIGLEALGKAKGIVPLVDREEGAEPRWFVMEKAKPLATHIRGKTFRYLVEVFAELADTLHRLRTLNNPVSHRDIKPDNLFWLEKGPVFGDFGIAGWTDRVRRTQELNKLGPFAYLAPEALRATHTTNWHAADVYSLAKSMWALAEYQYEWFLAEETDDEGEEPKILYPPQGEMNAMKEWAYSFRRFFGPEGRHLDSVLQDATSNDPARRPTAGELRDEFQAWLRLTDGMQAKPSPRSVYGTLVNRVERFQEARTQFLDTLRVEINSAFRDVTFDSSVNPNWRFDPESDVDDEVILASHGRDVTVDPNYEDGPEPDPWGGALVLELLSIRGDVRAIAGGVVEGTADRPIIDLLAEVHQPDPAGGWTLGKVPMVWDRTNMNAGGAMVVEALREILRQVVAAIPSVQSAQWRSRRVR